MDLSGVPPFLSSPPKFKPISLLGSQITKEPVLSLLLKVQMLLKSCQLALCTRTDLLPFPTNLPLNMQGYALPSYPLRETDGNTST